MYLSFDKVCIPIRSRQGRRFQRPRITTMSTPRLTILTRLLVVTFYSIYATPVASPGDLLASPRSWAICCRRRCAAIIGGECGKHEFNCRKTENPIDFRGCEYNLAVEGSLSKCISLFPICFPDCCWLVLRMHFSISRQLIINQQIHSPTNPWETLKSASF